MTSDETRERLRPGQRPRACTTRSTATGTPLVLLHGAYMTIDAMGPFLPRLAETRQVIAVEQQGHGRTADIDRPITYEQMADDIAALLRHLGSSRPTSSATAWAAASPCSSPSATRTWCASWSSPRPPTRSDGMHAEALEMFPSITPEIFAGSPIEEDYLRLAPNPGDFPKLVEKLKTLDTTPFAWPPEDIRGDRGADPDRRRRLRRHPPRARRRAVPAARRRRDGRPGRPPEVPARRAAGHHALHPARQRAPRPRRLAAGDDRRRSSTRPCQRRRRRAATCPPSARSRTSGPMIFAFGRVARAVDPNCHPWFGDHIARCVAVPQPHKGRSKWRTAAAGATAFPQSGSHARRRAGPPRGPSAGLGVARWRRRGADSRQRNLATRAMTTEVPGVSSARPVATSSNRRAISSRLTSANSKSSPDSTSPQMSVPSRNADSSQPDSSQIETSGCSSSPPHLTRRAAQAVRLARVALHLAERVSNREAAHRASGYPGPRASSRSAPRLHSDVPAAP